MKVKNIFKSLVFLVCLFSTGAVFSQNDYVWDYYKLQVTLPNDFKEIMDNENEFEVKGDGMELYMYVFADHHVTLEEMNTETVKVARQLKFEVTDQTTEINDDEFAGRYVLGYKDGIQIMVAGMIQKNNGTNLWIAIAFADGDKEAEHEGIKIINSLKHTK